MTGFEFQTVPSILNQPGVTANLGDLLKDRFAAQHVMLFTDPGILKAGLLEAPLASLAKVGIRHTIFDDVVADPPEDLVLKAVDVAQKAGIDVVVGFGGGSSMDVAKLVAVLKDSDQQLKDIYGIGNVSGGRTPLIQVPTTAGTGSEVTPISIITTGATTKMGVVSPVLYADLAILDAELTLGLPAHVTSATGIDAMVHAIEAYTSAHKKNPISDGLACQALKLLSANLVAACTDPGNVAARADMLLGAMLAGQAFSNAPVAAVHALAYPIGGIFHVPHGLSNALVLPHVLRFNAPAAAPLYAELADVLIPGIAGSDDAKTQGLIAHMDGLAEATGIKTKLSQIGINHNDLPRLAEDAMLQTRLLVNNPREVTYDDALAIYQAAL